MATITKRATKGSPLTNDEVDANFENLNTDKLETSGGSVTGDISFGDNDKAIFGAGPDLQIFHDGSHSYISDTGTGQLRLKGDVVAITNQAVTDYIALFNENADVKLFYDNSAKLATTNTGIDVTGTVTADGLTVDGNVSIDGGTIKLDGNYPVGTGNVALGNTALDSLTTGANNVAVGTNSLTANTIGTNNVATGYQALQANTTASNNVAYGTVALYANTTGASNVAVGTSALESNTEASNNTAVGYQSLYANTTGYDNVAVGANALLGNTIGVRNVAVGEDALDANTTGQFNTAVGWSALTDAEGANFNTAFGYNAGQNVTTGASNALFGTGAGNVLTTGSNNTFVGANTSVGNSGGLITTGSKNTILGGYNGNQGGLDIRESSNNIVLSDGDGNPRIVVDSSGNTGIGTINPSFPLDVDGAIRGNSWIGRANTSAPTADAFIFRPADGTLGLGTSNTEQLRIDSGGNLDMTYGAGNIIMANGAGINFSASEGAGATSSLLDDYEEGTFTPTVYGGTTAGTTTYTVQAGHYTKVGRQVTIVMKIHYTAATGTGTFNIGGLPFSGNVLTGNESVGTVMVQGFNWTAGAYLTTYINTSTMQIYINTDDANITVQSLSNETAIFWITQTYFTD